MRRLTFKGAGEAERASISILFKKAPGVNKRPVLFVFHTAMLCGSKSRLAFFSYFRGSNHGMFSSPYSNSCL